MSQAQARLLRNTLLALALPLGIAGTAAAQPTQDLKRVEVRGHTLMAKPLGRTDVRNTCPGVDQELQRSLARSWSREQQSGIVRVDFQLDGQQISEVRSSGGPRLYYDKAIRSAVHQLNCDAKTAGAQGFTMLISFAEESQAAQGQTVALLMP